MFQCKWESALLQIQLYAYDLKQHDYFVRQVIIFAEDTVVSFQIHYFLNLCFKVIFTCLILIKILLRLVKASCRGAISVVCRHTCVRLPRISFNATDRHYRWLSPPPVTLTETTSDGHPLYTNKVIDLNLLLGKTF